MSLNDNKKGLFQLFNYRDREEPADNDAGHMIDFQKDKEMLFALKKEANKEKAARKAPVESLPEKKPAPAKGGKPKDRPARKPIFNRHEWVAPRIIKTNLIETEGLPPLYGWRDIAAKTLLALSLSVFLVALMYAGVCAWGIGEAKELDGLLAEKESLLREVDKARTNIDEIKEFEKKLIYAGRLLDSHIYWTNFFAFLEKNLLTDISVQNGFSGNTGGDYSFAMVGDSFDMLADQVRVLRANELVKEAGVNAGNVSAGTGTAGNTGSARVSFQLRLLLDQAIFHK